MFRLRRYRYYVFFAAIIVFLLFRVSQNSKEWEETITAKLPIPRAPSRKSVAPPPRIFTTQDGDLPQKILDNTGKGKTKYPPKKETTPEISEDPPVSSNDRVSDKISDKVNEDPAKPHLAVDEKKPALAYDHDEAATVKNIPSIKLPSKNNLEQDGQGAKDATLPKPTDPHWKKPEEHFPVPKDEIIPLPTGKPLKIPRVQYSFDKEFPKDKERREARQDLVRAEMKRSWDGYIKYARGHDELRPVTKTFRDPFCGWAATLVDSLDTLWIMGLKEEFEDALTEVAKIDFTTSKRTEIPVFETTIRYLGGLIAAYDVSGGEDGGHSILLDKAVELAEILMGVFDTPNRMPILYYNWNPATMSQPKRAPTTASVAELGSLAMEFTRLAQITKQNKYYDAVARITDAFYEWQERGTTISGIFPERIDASGCNTTAQRELEEAQRKSEEAQTKSEDDEANGSRDSNMKKRSPVEAVEVNSERHSKALKMEATDPALPECVSQGLTPLAWGPEQYGMGGSQDSTYEYFPKQWLLLGGLEPKYEELHRQVSQAVKKWLLYRPMVPDDSDILFSAKIGTRGEPEHDANIQYEVTHLTCFLGGMFGLGGRIFDIPADVEVGKKLSQGCVWAYSSTESGIMPEFAHLLACEDADYCHWNETRYNIELDPSYDKREEELEAWYDRKEKLKAHKKELLEIKKKEQEAALLRKESQEDRESSRVDNDNAQDPVKGFSQIRKRAPTYKDEDEDTGHRASDSVRSSSKQVPLVKDEEDGEDLEHDPTRPISHANFIKKKIAESHLPPGYVTVESKSYILRPEAIESVWYMYRITGDEEWQEKGWKMFKAITKHTATEVGNSAIDNVLIAEPRKNDEMESFWQAETLKYFYLLYSEPDVINLDEWVLNTEAHPFKRPTTYFGA
ncbi:glycoside hydrolase family 47 protein [Xylariaceae sp. FL0255]|nr:glycoside hydrolase family 47 protein [Xylariaceae sp. FL0255]